MEVETITIPVEEYEMLKREATAKKHSKTTFQKVLDEYADEYGNCKVRAAISALIRAKYKFSNPTAFPTAKINEVEQFIANVLELTYEKMTADAGTSNGQEDFL